MTNLRPVLNRHCAVSVTLAEATSGTTVIFGLTGVAVLILMGILTDFDGYVPGGGNTLNIPLSFCFFLGPLMAGMSAVRAGRLHTQGAFGLAASTPRGRSGLFLVLWFAYTAWAVVAYTCFTVLTAVLVGVNGPWTMTMSLLTAQALALLGACVVLGLVVGCRISSPLVGPGLTILMMIALNYLDLAPNPIGRVSPIFPGVSYSYELQPNAHLLAALVATSLGVMLCLVGVAGYLRRNVGFTVSAVGVLIRAGGAFQAVTASSDATQIRTGGPGLCRGQDVVVLCVWPGPDVEIDESLRALVAVRGVMTRFRSEPTHFRQVGLTGGTDSRIVDIATPGDHASVWAFAKEAMVPPACSASTMRVRNELFGLINELLRPASMGPEGPYVELRTGPISKQRAWVATRLTALAACRSS